METFIRLRRSRRPALLTIAMVSLLAAAFPFGNLGAVPPPHAPTLSVHESSYGTTRTDHGQESILSLDIRIVSHDPSDRVYRAECFFLKKGKHGAEATVDDAAAFDVIRPHATYRISAKPIAIKAPKATSTTSKSGKGKASVPRNPPTDLPREGYVVRISSNGELLRECSSYPILSEAIARNPSLLDADKVRKRIRELDPATLIVR